MTNPLSVNLIALLIRLLSICPRILSSTKALTLISGIVKLKEIPLSDAATSNSFTVSFITSETLVNLIFNSILFASILDKSRIELSVSVSLFPPLRMSSAISNKSGSVNSEQSISAKPRIPVIGVLSSWLILARKLDFRRFASSARSFAFFSSCSAIFLSVISSFTASI